MTVRVLIFGKTGQVASSLQKLTGSNLEVTALSRREADFLSPNDCTTIVKNTEADVVINAVAFNAVDRAETESEHARIVNADTPGAIAQACASRNLPFLHISSDYVFSGKKDGGWLEDDPTHPVNTYGHSKLSGENAVRDAGGDYVILRTSWVFSSHGRNFLKTMLRLNQANQKIRVVNDQIGGPTGADAIASTLIEIARKFVAGKGVSGTFHYSGEPAISWHGFAEEILAGMAPAQRSVVEAVSSKDWGTPTARPQNSTLNCAKILETYGIVQPDWRADVTSVIEDVERHHGS